ncbi:hypothetical protein [Paenibacillus wynnii]|uniref:hypothetical protein n=1 Tax=Paenibacillus wynnii TaxID=268407 RepID=UPI00278ECDEF|nr:hypothetical protein [Paenibacillus wynnii]MDQ0193356.1 DeoR/GlpR family transcriptional regulator of sugar metabolism [Paenibacillus wynnii]
MWKNLSRTRSEPTALTKLVELNRIDYLITDRKPSEAWLQRLSEANIEVMY